LPILNGRHVSLAEWRASQAQAAAQEAVVDEPESEETVAPLPRQRRRPSRREQVVQAALGINPGSPDEGEDTTGDQS